MRVRSPQLISHKWRDFVPYGRFCSPKSRIAFLWRDVFILFCLCLVFLFLFSLNSRPSVQLFFNSTHALDSHMQLANTCLGHPLLFLFLFLRCYVIFPEYYAPSSLPFPFLIEITLYIFLTDDVFFQSCDHELDFDTSSFLR